MSRVTTDQPFDYCYYCGSTEHITAACEQHKATQEQIEERSRKMHALALEALRKLTSAERRAIGYVAIHGNLWDLTWEARKPAQEAPQPQPVVPCRRDPETCSCDQHVGKPGNVWDGK